MAKDQYRIRKMGTLESNSASDSVDVYRIRVKGQLDPSWSDWLGGFAIRPQGYDSTLLTGPIVDQAALQGILNKLYGMNLILLSLERANDREN
jgi:hypothetical protein